MTAGVGGPKLSFCVWTAGILLKLSTVFEDDMRITTVKAWESRDYNYTREERIGFGAQAQAILDESEGDTSEHALDALMKLFRDVIDPAIKQEVKEFAERSSTFRLAMQTVKPQIIRRFSADNGDQS